MPLRSSLVGHATVYASGLALQALGGLLVLPFVTRTLGPEEYGRVAVAIVVMMLVGLLVSGGAQLVLLAEYYRDRDGLGARVLAAAVATASALVAVASVAALVALPSGSTGRLVAASVLAAAGLATVSIAQAMFRAMQRPGRFLAVTLASTVGAQLAGLVAAQGPRTAEAYMTGYATLVCLAAVIGATGCRLVRPWRHWDQLSGRVRLIAPVVPQSFALLGLVAGDVALVAWLLGDVEAGRYQVAWILGSVSYYSASAVGNAWSPRAMDDAAATGGWAYLASTGRVVLAVVAGIGVVVAAVSPVALPILAPAEFDPDDLVVVVAVLALSGPAAVLYLGSANVLLRAKRTPLLLALTVMGAVTMAVLTISLLPSAGIVAAALGKVGGLLVLGVGASLAGSRDAGPLLSSWRVLVTLVSASTASGMIGLLGGADAAPVGRAAAAAVLVGAVVLMLAPLGPIVRSPRSPRARSEPPFMP